MNTHVESQLLKEIPALVHGFGTFDEPILELFKKDWERTRPIWKQVHGVAVSKVEALQQNCGDVDALFTLKAQVPIAVVTADCVPILLAHRDGKAVAAVHAGWRGTFGHILKSLWRELKQAGESPRDWFATVGPAIGPCCYEVSEELALQFSGEFAQLEKSVVTPRHRYLDLPAINAAELQEIGIGEVEILRHCTRCGTNPKFHSYRREGSGTRQYSMIMAGDNHPE